MTNATPISELPIRLLTIDEAPQFAAHISRNLKTSGLNGTPIFSMRSRTSVFDEGALVKKLSKGLSMETEHGWEKVWAAWDQGLVIGAVSLQTNRYAPSSSQSHRAMLGMGIESGYRHRGLGKRLMNEAVQWAKAQDFLKWLDLGVFAGNAPARRLYESCGFIECGRTIDAFRVDGHRIDDIQMILDLDQLR